MFRENYVKWIDPLPKANTCRGWHNFQTYGCTAKEIMNGIYLECTKDAAGKHNCNTKMRYHGVEILEL